MLLGWIYEAKRSFFARGYFLLLNRCEFATRQRHNRAGKMKHHPHKIATNICDWTGDKICEWNGDIEQTQNNCLNIFQFAGRGEPSVGGVGDPCAGCNKPILDKFLLNVLERGWHASCVRCCECLTPLTDKCFSRESKLYCRNDFYRWVHATTLSTRRHPPGNLLYLLLIDFHSIPLYLSPAGDTERNVAAVDRAWRHRT